MIQLPDDVISKGYKQHKTNKFQFEQIFYSKKHNFEGTEKEFLNLGFAYEYIEISNTRRLEIIPIQEQPNVNPMGGSNFDKFNSCKW